ncbi:MAG: DUF5663 domain-containing protein [Acidobacteriota bacterium]
MAILTPDIVRNLGIELVEADMQSLAEHFEATLDERVINEIVLGLTPEQAQQLAELQQAGDDTILEWLQANVPDLADIVSDEIDILLGELAESSETLE